MGEEELRIMDQATLIVREIPKCQFCKAKAKYEAVSTDPDTIHNWVYVCEKDMSAKTIDDESVKILQLAE
jgi:hypothetical protein